MESGVLQPDFGRVSERETQKLWAGNPKIHVDGQKIHHMETGLGLEFKKKIHALNFLPNFQEFAQKFESACGFDFDLKFGEFEAN